MGGFDKVKLDTGADLVALGQLDQKLWVALSCPTKGLEFDSKSLDLIDTDRDGRIRVPEILTAVNWATACVKNVDEFFSGSEFLPLQAINDSTEEGKQLLASAQLKLRQRNLGPILDASGWAVNARVKVNIAFGRSLTGTAKLPPGASRSLQDPYRDESARAKLWFWGILVLMVAAVVTYYVLKTYVLAP